MRKHTFIITMHRDGKRFVTVQRFADITIAYYAIQYYLNKFWWMDLKIYKSPTWHVIPIYFSIKLGRTKRL